ncbi:MAG: type II secretion system protein [Candidatus Gracilibacteria bacterium]|jgi:prepilin-type N-terminal cleavage/methylation domain-containing protein
MQKSAPSFRLRAVAGFTMIEILLVISIMVIIAAAGLANTISSQKYFDFTSIFKQIMIIVRQPRVYAVTNYTIQDPPYIPTAYGIDIRIKPEDTGKFIFRVFADMESSGTLGQYDPSTDVVIGDSLEIDATKYGIKAYTNTEITNLLAGSDIHGHEMTGVDDHSTFFYSPPLAGYSSDVSVDTLNKQSGTLYLKIYNLNNEKDINRFIAIFDTGIAEAFYLSGLSTLPAQ